MSYIAYIPETSGLNLYAKALPLNSTWSVGVVTLSESGSTGQYSATLEDDVAYFVYQRSGVSPASSDLRIGSIGERIQPTNIVQANGAVIELFDEDDLVTPLQLTGTTVVPSAASVSSRAGENYILSYTAETNTYSITVLDGANEAIDLTGKVLGVYWETFNKDAVAAVTSNVDIEGVDKNVITFSVPSAVTTEERRLKFAVREQEAPKAVFAGGVWDVQHLPSGS